MGTNTAAPSTLANVTDLIKLFYPSGGATSSSNNTSTTNNSSSVSQDKIDAIIKGVLESNSGMASIANMQKSAGLRDSSTNLLLQNDLIARAAAEGAKLQTNTTSTTSNSAAGKTTPTASLSPGTAVGAVAGLQALSPILKGMDTTGAKKFGNNIYDSVFGKTPTNSGATPATMSGSSDISVSDIMGSGDANAAADAAANAARDAVGPSIDFTGTAGLPDAIGNAVGSADASSAIADGVSAADGVSGAYDTAAGFSNAAEAASAASAASDAASAAVDTSGSVDWGSTSDWFGGFFGDGGRVPTKESMLDKARNLFAGNPRIKTIDKVDAAETGGTQPDTYYPEPKKEEEPPKPFRFADGGRVPRIGARSLATGGANTIDRTNSLNELGIGVGADAGTDNSAASIAEYRKAQGGNALYTDPSLPAGTKTDNINPDTAAAINAVGSFFGPVGSLITHGAIGTANSSAVQDQSDAKNSLAEASMDGNPGNMMAAQDDSTRAHLDATGAAIGGAADGLVGAVDGAGNATESAMGGVTNVADAIFSGVASIGHVFGFADGGSVPTSNGDVPKGKVPGHDLNGTDNVHVMLTGGEQIIPTDVVDILGQDFFDGLIKKFHKPSGSAASAAKPNIKTRN